MNSQVEYEAYNVTPPMKNTTGLKCIGAVIVTQTSQAINLSDYFGALGEGHFITFQADGAKVYLAFASNNQGTVDETASGNAAGVGWPIPDGQQQPFRLVGGRERSTGYVTNINVASGIVVHAKLAQSGVSTGWLRFYRSSVGPQQGVEQFMPNGFPVPIAF